MSIKYPDIVQWWPFIKTAADSHGLDPYMLASLVAQESSGNHFAERTEPLWRYRKMKLPKPKGMSKWTEFWGQARSYGLCQIMGTVAREQGHSGWWGELFKPELNLKLGAKLLADFIAWGERKGKYKGETEPVRIGLLRYNGGANKAYPDKVLKWAEKIKLDMED